MASVGGEGKASGMASVGLVVEIPRLSPVCDDL